MLLFGFFSLIFLILPAVFVHAQNTDLWPAAYPLAVRSPYLQAWESSMNGSQPIFSWPVFWSGEVCARFSISVLYIVLTLSQNLGWVGYIRIDGQTYRWLGQVGSSDNSTQASNMISRQITPTRSIFTMQAGPMVLNVTFLSPIEVSTRLMAHLLRIYDM